MTFKVTKRVYVAALFYLAWVALYLAYDYSHEKQLINLQLDNKLEASARALPQMLPDGFHHQDMTKSDPLPQQDIANARRLTRFTQQSEIVFIYGMIVRDGQIHFTSTSATEDEIRIGNHPRYLDLYADADPRLLSLTADSAPLFIEISDQWGNFRSVFIPNTSEDGTFYITAADIEISHIRTVLARRLMEEIALAGLFALFLLPLMFTFSSAQRSWARELERNVSSRTQELNESKRRLSSILSHSPVGIFHYDNNSELTMINHRFEQIIGASSDRLIGFNMLENLQDPKLLDALRDSLQGEIGIFEGPYISVTGHRQMHLKAEFVPIVNGLGKVDGGVAVFDDITDQVEATNALKKLSTAVEQSPNVVVITNKEGNIEYVNPHFTEVTGYQAEEVIGRNPRLLNSGEASNNIYEDLWNTLLSGQIWRGTLHNRKKSGELYWAEEIISPLTNDQGEITHFVALQEDITEVRRISDEINFQSTHDSLTGLLNRRQFDHELEHVIDSAHQKNTQHVLCFFDIDQFKIINDTCGHLAGDELLRQISHLIRDRLRSRDILARPGGDEFLLLIKNCSLAQGERVVMMIMNELKKFRFQWQDRSFQVEISAGLTAINDQTESTADAMKEVDTACYTAKDAGRNRIHIYRADDARQLAHKGYIQWATEIRNALDEDRFKLYAQAIQPLQSDDKLAYEVLIRLQDRNGDIIPPGAFLPAAERYNLTPRIDRWVISQTLNWMTLHMEQLSHINSLSINLSGQSLGDEALLGFIIRSIEHGPVPPQMLKFEITETAAIANLKDAQIFIKSLQGLGCQFALDDFGSGLSSFGYLKNLPVDLLKIDGMFVKDILTDPIDEAMVRSINEIGHIMNMQTIAEFVENDEIRLQLQQMGVDFGQGYGIGKPQPLNTILQPESIGADQSSG